MSASTPVACERVIDLDVHAHVIPLRRADVSDLPGVSWSDGNRLVVDGTELPKRELYDVDALIAWMNAHRVAKAWISVPPTLYRTELDASDAERWTRTLNAGLARVATHAPQRLEAMFHLPVQHPEVAAAIARDAALHGQRRFAMPAGDATRARTLSHAEYVLLWEALESVRAFLFLHPGRSCDPRFEALSLSNLLGGPTETAIAAAHLAMAGVLERYPAITFCLAHGGGTTAAVAGRLARGQDTHRPGAYAGGERVRRALTRCHVDCITHDAATLVLAASTFGRERILFGSDWPFDMGLPDPHTQLADLPDDLLQAIFVDNPKRVLT